MSGSTNNFTLTPGHRQPGLVYPPRDLDFFFSEFRDHDTDSRGAPQDPWWSFEQRGVTGSYGFASFPPPPPPPLEIILMAREVNSRSRPSLLESSSRLFVGQQNMPSTLRAPEESRVIRDEQQQALMKLKKEVYNPSPKRIIQRLNLYYRERAQNGSIQKGKEMDDEDGKRCAVCLDDFEPKEVVMLTPCSHMFHEECIVPWVKSHSHCPVCRSSIWGNK